MGVHVQYGCGFSPAEGWSNFDCSPSLRLERLPVVGRFVRVNASRFPAAVRYGDIVKGRPVTPESADGVYASHVREHLSLADCRTALANTRRLLRPGGVFRLVVPDLAERAGRYLRHFEQGEAQASMTFMDSTLLGVNRRPRGLAATARRP